MGDDPRNSINKPDAGTLESADGVLLLRVVDVLRLRSMYAWHTDEETPCRTYWISALKKDSVLLIVLKGETYLFER